MSARDSATPVLLLMDSPRKTTDVRPAGLAGCVTADTQAEITPKLPRRASTRLEALKEEDGVVSASPSAANAPDALGLLLVDMTAQVQDERAKRSEAEKRNLALVRELEQVQREVVELKTSQEHRRRSSCDWDATRFKADEVATPTTPRELNAEFWWREVQEVKQAKEKALVDAHQSALQVVELNACVSMQHDELKALHATENELRSTLAQTEERCKEVLHQTTVLEQENQLLKDEVAHLNSEIGKRGVHFKALMDKWTEAQALSEHFERENHAMLEKMKELRERNEQLVNEAKLAVDERDVLQHQVNHLKGAVAAKAAESKAFQAYGSNAREHLQAQNTMLQRHQIFRRKIHRFARDSVLHLKSIKNTLNTVRAPMVSIQSDFRVFLKNLQTPVLTLVARSRRYVEIAHIEHQPLRAALAEAEQARRHLHDQIWRTRRNALLVCQIRNAVTTSDPTLDRASAAISTASSILQASSTSRSPKSQTTTPCVIRANYATRELLLREDDLETLTIPLDTLYSDRSRESYQDQTIRPVLQSLLDGFNVCVATFDSPWRLVASPSSGRTPTTEGNVEQSAPQMMLTQLFETASVNGAHFHRVHVTVSVLAVCNERVFDLLSFDPTDAASAAAATTAQMHKIVVLDVQNIDEALLVLQGAQATLEAADAQGSMDRLLTHKIVTVCVTHESLLCEGSVTTAKLQILELALGRSEDEAAGVAAFECASSSASSTWDDDRLKVRSCVMLESGLHALTTTLADVRERDVSFVRYHSSKLTALLQDTLRTGAKFVALVALPSVADGSDPRVTRIARWLRDVRQAVSGDRATQAAASSERSSRAVDRSVEGFISRFTQHAQSECPGSASTMALATTPVFVPMENTGNSKTSPRMDVDPTTWGHELDAMGRRYGDLQHFSTAFFDPTATGPASAPYGQDPAASPRSARRRSRSPSRVSALVESELDSIPIIDLSPRASSSPPRSPSTPISNPCVKPKTKTKPVKKAAKLARRLSNTLSPHKAGRAQTTMAKTRRKLLRPAVTEIVRSTMATTLAPSSNAAPASASTVRLLRETAASTLKRAASKSSDLTRRREPFR